MIQINPKVLAELKGSKGFGFKSSMNCKESKDYHNSSPDEQLEKNMIFGEIKTLIEQFQILPCDLSVTIGVQNGHQIMEGQIDALDQSSMNKSEEILEQMDNLIFDFSRRFKSSSFSIKYTQTVTITKMYKMDEFPYS